jgi:hypothetical protein
VALRSIKAERFFRATNEIFSDPRFEASGQRQGGSNAS